MAKRRWQITISMGYVGTDTTEEIDVLDEGLFNSEELAATSEEEVIRMLHDDAFEMAKEKIDIHIT